MYKKTIIASVVFASGIASFFLLNQSYSSQIESLTEERDEAIIQNEELHDEIKEMRFFLDQQGQMIERLEAQNDEILEDYEDLEEGFRVLEEELERIEEKVDEEADWVVFEATYYDANYQSTGKNPGDPAYGITASGNPVKKGRTIAVDPDVIPLGTEVLVQYPDGRIEQRVAHDTGRLIQGRIIDIYKEKATLEMGRHPVRVKVLDEV